MEGNRNSTEICRCCLAEGFEMKRMSTKKGQLLESYLQCTGIAVESISNSSSKSICESCETKLLLCHEFRALCQASHRVLEIQNVEIKEENLHNSSEYVLTIPTATETEEEPAPTTKRPKLKNNDPKFNCQATDCAEKFGKPLSGDSTTFFFTNTISQVTRSPSESTSKMADIVTPTIIVVWYVVWASSTSCHYIHTLKTTMTQTQAMSRICSHVSSAKNYSWPIATFTTT
jgi:Zinc-finger associated domain (zf-AD)